MRVSDHIRQIREFLDRQTGEEMEQRFLRLASDVRDAVRDRVQTAGQDRTGQAFAPYVPDYAKRRAKAGYQIRKVDYTRTGRLWASILPEVVERTDTGIVIEIGPRGEDNRVKLLGPGTTKPRKDGVQRGLPTLPNEAELTEAFAVLVEEIAEDFERTVR